MRTSPEKALLEAPEQVQVDDFVIPELGRVLFIIKISHRAPCNFGRLSYPSLYPFIPKN
jgi:hypothetical protein